MADVGEIRARLILQNDDFKRKMADSRNEMSLTGKSAKQTSKELGGIQKASGAMAAGVLAVVGASVTVAATFEQSMSKLAGISNATEDQVKQLEAAAREMGATTQFSASQAAEGLSYLAMAGFTVEEQINALPAVLNAAAAGNIDLASSADIVSNIMTGFGIKASESGHAVDVLVKTMTTANTNLPQLGDAMKYVAPVAASLGLSIEETAAAVAKMSDAGIQGSQAGTSLRAALLSLANPTGQTKDAMKELSFSVTDANGQMKPLPKLIGELATKMEGMTDAQKTATAAQLVGTEAASGFVTLIGIGEEKLADYTKTLEDSGGTAETMAKKMQDNLLGAFKEFQSALEEIGIIVGNEFLPMFTDIVKASADIVRSFGDIDGASVKANTAFAGTAAVIALVLSSVGKLAIAMKTLMISMGPAGWVITGLSLIGGAFASAKVYGDDYNEVTLESVDAMKKQRDELSQNITEYDMLSSKSKLTADELARFVDINSEISKTADPEVIKRLGDEQKYLYERSGLSNDELDRLVGLNGDILAVVPESNTVLTDQGNVLLDNTDAAKKFNAEQADMIRLELEAKRTKLEANMEDLLRKEEEAQKDINEAKERMIELDGMERDEIALIGQLEDELAIAKENNDTLEIDRLNETIALHVNKLDSIKKQRAEQAGVVLENAKTVDEVQKEIGKLDQVKQRMVEIELSQAGINAKKGEEMRTLESELGTLYKQKAELDNIKDSATRNTEEYRQQQKEINDKISKLEGVRSKIHSIIGTADTLNSRLGQDVTKRVYIKEYGARTFSQARRAAEGVGAYHTGGLVGRGQMPKLHVGGLASQFAQAPKHNEIDVRLLRNEMVLTESQQANLMRMIDAGSQPKENGSATPSTIANTITNHITVEGNIDSELYAEIMNRQTSDFNTEVRNAGVKFNK
jgi:TP901 family phage tail tape measure protein